MEMIKPIHPIGWLEPPYSIIDRRVEENILDYCGKNNIGVVTYSSLQQGLLGGFPIDLKKLGPEDVRRRTNYFREPEFSINWQFGQDLAQLAKKYGRTAAQMAIAWNLRRPEVTSAITAPRAPSEIEDTCKAADWNLTQGDLSAIDKLFAKRQETIKAALAAAK
jgi:aryl-alcohol dehydrogenase-like predicted oxidoreductase